MWRILIARDRKEVEFLQQQLKDHNQEYKAKESRMQLTIDRLKRKIFEIEKRNKELTDEVKVLEQERASFINLKVIEVGELM